VAVQPVVLAGGVGSRLAPLSTPAVPKQFLALLGDEVMIEAALRRTEQFGGGAKVIGRKMHRELLRKHCPGRQLIFQPGDRGTAAALALTALLSRGPDVMVVLPSDHSFGNEQALSDALAAAVAAAETGEFVCFGVTPTNADSSFGYLAAANAGSSPAPLTGFLEKPSGAKAQELIAEGWMWNSGMFVVRADVLISELRRFEPELLSAVEQSLLGIDVGTAEIEPAVEAFLSSPSASIDRGVLERTDVSSMVLLDAAWNDVGTWPRLWEAAGLSGAEILQLPHVGPIELGELVVADGLVLVSEEQGTYLAKR
jgi:mannose-1-phosphate guanylyltransferase/mannose-6-phosphate isomerase